MELRFDVVLRYLPFLLRGVQGTFLVTITSMSLGLLLGLFVAIARLSQRRWLGRMAEFYVDTVRALPPLVILVWIFYVSPIAVGVSLSPFASAIIGLSVYASSYLAEIFRAGIRSIERGQWDASRALGMNPIQVMRRVIMPQAVVRMLPPFGGLFITLFKDSAIVSAIGVADLMRQGLTLSVSLVRPIEVFTVVGIVYLVLTYPQTVWVNYLHRRFLSH